MEHKTEATMEMPQYQSHKKVWALKIKAVQFIGPNGETTPEESTTVIMHFEDPLYGPRQEETENRPTPGPGWFFLVYEDGYHSFSPAAQFEDGYTKIEKQVARTNHTFAEVIDLLKDGKRLARKGWNGKGLFVFLVPGSTFKVNRPPLLGIYPEGTDIEYHAHVDIRSVDGKIVPWTPSQTDMLAHDWEIVE